MDTPTQQTLDKTETNASGDTALGFVVLGLLTAGVVGVWKAIGMPSGLEVMFCLFGSTAAFGGVYYILFGKR